MLPDALHVQVTRALEEGRVRDAPVVGAVARFVARGVGVVTARALARPVSAPDGVRLVTVGGATLGGSGKTRLALAVTRSLAARGVQVALVGHAYRARPGRARLVTVGDPIDAVGDEARACARALGTAAEVIVAPERQDAVALAASRGARVLVLDGPLSTRPSRPELALLALDADAPWGAGVGLPAGDLRAPVAALRAAADLEVEVAADPAFAHLHDARIPVAELVRVAAARGGALGLFTAMARPDRLLRALDRAGVRPAVVVAAPDHGPFSPHPLGSRNVAIWLASPKCAEHLRGRARALAVLEDAFVLPSVVEASLARFGGAGGASISAPTSAHSRALTPASGAP